ncbi:leucyl aminopeptidase [Sphingorhabdus soli]|uniref:Probable cytosol aminopeptidase n=1 Tax=Flavisphingopyxis soli TaxID=2601267 RepID=A0A5C6U7E6_9SPHN|nr:leucyl aminopeptidase [Sphingorhabdus soli]TXC68943.1 leucyl aminopeptidase [Sphingorhabdus soli]
MKFSFAASAPSSVDAVAYPIARDGLDAAAGRLPEKWSGLVRSAARAARFDGRRNATFETSVGEGDGSQRLILVGIAKGEPADLEAAGGALVARLLTSGVTSLAVDFSGSQLSDGDIARFLSGMQQRGWRIDTYRTRMKERDKPTLTDIVAVTRNGKSPAQWAEFESLYEGIALARELVSEPANILYPESFVERCRPMTDLGVEIDVLDESQMKSLGMGALLGVAQGSVRPPRLLVMRWNGTGDDAAKPVCLVGKGVTFDSGGISLKPGPGMEDMKWDMGGAAAVAGAMRSLASRRAKAHVIGICGLVENMPDANAQRPGDIVSSMSGQTIEVLNTDAEGRLVLCDALHWAQKTYAPDTIVDLATLTGAMIVALGHEHGGLFSNDDGLANALFAAGQDTGDKLWRLPLSPAYDKLLDSPIADIKNIGPRQAGSITAAQFLQRFIEPGVKWAHLDIAGMVFSDKDGPTWAKGATGYGVRLLDRFIAANHEG